LRGAAGKSGYASDPTSPPPSPDTRLHHSLTRTDVDLAVSHSIVSKWIAILCSETFTCL
jgi:hypothetical protein